MVKTLILLPVVLGACAVGFTTAIEHGKVASQMAKLGEPVTGPVAETRAEIQRTRELALQVWNLDNAGGTTGEFIKAIDEAVVLAPRFSYYNLCRIKTFLHLESHPERRAWAIRLYEAAMQVPASQRPACWTDRSQYLALDELATVSREMLRDGGDGPGRDKIDHWYRTCETLSVRHIPDLCSHAFFEHAIYTLQVGTMDEELAILWEGMKHIGRNPDRDGSLLHELAMATMRRAHTEKTPELLLEAVPLFDRAIACKREAGIIHVPLYSRKMQLEALSDYAVWVREKQRLATLPEAYGAAIAEWSDQVQRLEPAGQRAYPELLARAAFVCNLAGDQGQALRWAMAGEEACQRYDASNQRLLQDLATLRMRLQEEIATQFRPPVPEP